MIRTLLLGSVLVLGVVTDVKAQSGFDIALGGGYGSDGASGRVALGYERAGYVAAIRLAADGLFSDAPTERGIYQQRNVEIGVTASREVPLSESVGLILGAGLAYGVVTFDDVDEPFLLDNTAFTLQLPVEANVVFALSDRVGLTAGGYWSQGIARASGGGFADDESTSHGGLLLGMRLKP